ncbi:META domain-containing protein [Colwellia piezophila]|uniref:META domain-containing protein n=1 Tax=Colwellia piezophila TaxID=211668 RepID=UPI00035D3B90|nr:META domain-containing protein [Colwellia piezophila]
MIKNKNISLVVALATTLMACNSTTDLPTTEKLPGKFYVVSIQGKRVIDNSHAQLSFNADNKLTGSASCNNISSSYNSKNHSLSIGAIATTRKMCKPALMDQETLLLQAISKVKRFQLISGQLSMYDQQGQLQITAKRIKKTQP